MIRTPNPELDRMILNHLTELYNLSERREGIHLSTLVYCLTRSFLDYHGAGEPTDEELLLFALGYGLQDVITPKDATAPLYVQDGITYRPDMLLKIREDKLCEIKTTRTGLTKILEALPETWVKYIMGGCKLRGVKSYELSTLLICGNYHPPFPKIYSETLEFTDEEIEDNWAWLMERKAVYEDALTSGIQPTPFMYCLDWECNNCRYKLACQVLARQENGHE